MRGGFRLITAQLLCCHCSERVCPFHCLRKHQPILQCRTANGEPFAFNCGVCVRVCLLELCVRICVHVCAEVWLPMITTSGLVWTSSIGGTGTGRALSLRPPLHAKSRNPTVGPRLMWLWLQVKAPTTTLRVRWWMVSRPHFAPMQRSPFIAPRPLPLVPFPLSPESCPLSLAPCPLPLAPGPCPLPIASR